MSAEEVKHRVRIGSLIRVHRGVFRVGHRAPSVEATYLAAVLACGERALLSGRAAGYLLGIPVTSVPRTLVDLAAILAADDLARACHEAGVRHRTTPAQVEEVLARRPNAPGAAKLRAILGGDVQVTLSKLESRFLDRLREAGLPFPRTNLPAGSRRVDCRWPEARLTVELDGYRYHHSRHAWEQDRRREREAHLRGDELRRYTWGDVVERPEAMLAELRALLDQGTKTPSRSNSVFGSVAVSPSDPPS